MESATIRQRLYAGDLITLPPQHRLLEFLRSRVQAIFGDNYRQPRPDFMTLLTTVRKALQTEETRIETLQFLETIGLLPQDYAIDYLRMRGVAPGADLIPAAAPAFYAHRDTWYANPQSQINLWMPLHDVIPENSFAFYPDYFKRAVANDSEQFDYAVFKQTTGFQNPKAPKEAVYPRLLEELPVPQGIALAAGQVLLFASHHLHQTLPNRTNLTRFSVDLRIVHRADQAANIGAPNVDNRSLGNAMLDYPW